MGDKGKDRDPGNIEIADIVGFSSKATGIWLLLVLFEEDTLGIFEVLDDAKGWLGLNTSFDAGGGSSDLIWPNVVGCWSWDLVEADVAEKKMRMSFLQNYDFADFPVVASWTVRKCFACLSQLDGVQGN